MARVKKTWVEQNKDYLVLHLITSVIRVPEIFSQESLKAFTDAQFEIMCKDLYSTLRFLSPYAVDYVEEGATDSFRLDGFVEKMIKRFLKEQFQLSKREIELAVDMSGKMANIRITLTYIVEYILWKADDSKELKKRFKSMCTKEIIDPFFKIAPRKELVDFYLEEATLVSYMIIKEFPLNPFEWKSFLEEIREGVINATDTDVSAYNDVLEFLKEYFTT